MCHEEFSEWKEFRSSRQDYYSLKGPMHAAVTEGYLHSHGKSGGGDQDNYNAVSTTFHRQMVLLREICHAVKTVIIIG